MFVLPKQLLKKQQIFSLESHATEKQQILTFDKLSAFLLKIQQLSIIFNRTKINISLQEDPSSQFCHV